METTAIPTTKVVNFSELSSLELTDRENYKNIPVKKSDNPRCIYKVFKLTGDDTGILIKMSKTYKSSSFGFGGGYTTTVEGAFYEINPQHEHQRTTFTEPEIEIIVDEKIQVTPHQDGDRHYQRQSILVKGEKHNLKFFLPHRIEGDVRERDGKFFVEHYGVWFDLVPTYYQQGNNTESLFQSINYIEAKFTDIEQMNRYLVTLAKEKKVSFVLNTKAIDGISKTMATIQPFYEELIKDPKDILSLIAFKHAVEASKRTINNVKFSVIINKIFADVKDEKQFNDKIKEMSVLLEETANMHKNGNEDYRDYHARIMDSIPEAREIKKAALKRKSTGAINKIMDDLDFIKIDKDKYPLTHEAIFAGEIPKGTFFRKNGDSYFVYNDNWDIWEEMLALHKEVAISIATECSRRTTFEKDIMSYFFFVLHKLPEYLEKQTGKKWKCFPKLVSAEKELDPPTEGDNGVAKTRSALTPIVDNDKNEVIVPYVSMRLSGYQTSYCYGLDYNVLERGMSFMGNSVTRDVEKNLNGRDDYGLMFYTLTGSAQAQGYPTFLIIFEHLDKTTKVHFHRTHPMRSKGGDYNPIHGWVIGCYKWMVGNVNFERIKAQQGDLVFVGGIAIEPISADVPLEFTEVNSYDNHMFEHPVKFLPYNKKEKNNILGYFRIEKDTMLNHHEHKPRLIPAGDYELRQCRSWEANPKGIWSLRID